MSRTPAGSRRARRGHEVPHPQREHLAPDQPGGNLPGEDPDDHAEPEHRRSVADRDDQYDEQERDRQQYVHDPHQEPVEQPAGQAGHRAPDRADDHPDDRGQKADLQRGPAADHQFLEHVEALVVGAQRVPGGRRHVGGGEVGSEPAVVDQRPEVAEQHEEDQRGQPQDGQLVLGELACGQPPAALHRADGAALGHVLQARRRKFGGDVGHEVSRAIRRAGSAGRRPSGRCRRRSSRRRPGRRPPACRRAGWGSRRCPGRRRTAARGRGS